MSLNLNPEKALIFRIVHVANVPWILEHGGLHCRNFPEQDPNYVNNGSAELIEKRSRRVIPIPPGGNDDVKGQLELLLEQRREKMSVKTAPTWYF